MPIVADEYTHVIGVRHARQNTHLRHPRHPHRRRHRHRDVPDESGWSRSRLAWIDRRTPAGLLAAVEGTSSYGASLTEAMQQADIPVVEARPPRRADRGARGKSDPIDAEAAARAVLRTDTALLSWPRTGKIRSALRVLLAARRSMDGQRTASRSALTALLRTIDLGIDARRPLTDSQITSIAAWRHRPSDDVDRTIARAEAVRLARDVIALTGKLNANHNALEEYVSALAPTVLDIAGVGPVSAAVLLTADRSDRCIVAVADRLPGVRCPVAISLVASDCSRSSQNNPCASRGQATADGCRRQHKLPTTYSQQQTADDGSDKRQRSHDGRCTAHRMRHKLILRAVPHGYSDPRDGRGNRNSQWDRDL
ncbi:hypothetical protein DEJ27_00075 [Curtobacterium sp. MCPF17_018]|uniref:IS110 family transposase n=1 Tax=Curtobacterium sp. MCPF17_018 TaxID=2175638 RepID=UPI000DA94917|nr:transposase [Curtobacterium sp. MCPF17_018]PZE72896.1 hypothetical protein DEJ27_00075 [Curtobacterium sp. MCPF17_018]